MSNHDFAGIGVYGRERAARAGLAVLRRRVRLLYAFGALAPADSRAPWTGGGAAARSAGGSAARFAEVGIAARTALPALRRQPVRRRRCRTRRGARNLVGSSAGVVGTHSRNDGRFAARISLGSGAAKLRCGGVSAAIQAGLRRRLGGDDESGDA